MGDMFFSGLVVGAVSVVVAMLVAFWVGYHRDRLVNKWLKKKVKKVVADEILLRKGE